MAGLSRGALLVAGVSLWLGAMDDPAQAASSPNREARLRVSQRNGRTALAVEVRSSAGLRRHSLRETSATVRAGARGSDPSGGTLFVDWSEGAERWFSFSADAGRTWSEPRRLETALRLHAGAVKPGMAMPAVPPALALPEGGRLFLVQFRTLSLPAWREALSAAGAEPLVFFPYNAHVVRMGPKAAAEVESFPFIQRVEPYHPFYRIEDALLDWLAQDGGNGQANDGSLRVNVVAVEWGPAVRQRIAERAEALGARVASNPEGGQLMELWVDRDQLRQVAALDEVLWIDRWQAPEADMDLVRQDSGAVFLESGFSQCGQGVRGEVMDVGIDSAHQDFDGIMMHTAGPVDSHGTATYGIVFGNGNRDGDGNPQGTGHLVCSSQGIYATAGVPDRFVHTQQLKQSPYFASFQSNSWGNGLTRAYTSLSQQMDDIIWRLDIAITQSQSNTGNQDSRPQAWAKNIISVGGVRHRNTLDEADDAWAFGGSIGPAADGRLKPDLNYWYDSIFTTAPGNAYTAGFGGTSAATPEVAGVLGLMVQMWSENAWSTNPTGATVFDRQPHAATIKALLINNARQYAFTGTDHDLTRVHQGWGRPSVQIARQRAANSFIVDQATALGLNQAVTYAVDVLAGETELKVTMVYADPPGTTSATVHRINDLDLKVTAPNGTVYYGNNGLEAGTSSTSGGSPNTVDTVENVFIAGPAAGRWTVEVRAAEVNQDAWLDTNGTDATYALVVTGARKAP